MDNKTCRYCKYIDMSDSGGTVTYASRWCRLKGEYVYVDDYCYDYEFDKNATGCYLTSACVDYLGKEDDCEELTTLRNFRDTYMKSTEEGRKLVEEYYAVAPEIVKRIDSSDKKDSYYRYISEIINKCVSLINQKEYEKTMQEYKSMVLHLKNEFNL